MKISHWLLAIMINVPLLTGCATLSKNETLSKETCLTGNWESIGFEDGAIGRPSSYLANYHKACAKVGGVTNYQLWETGWEQGLVQYCTVTNAYDIGREGKHMSDICPAPIMSKLEQVNADGRQYYSFNKQLTLEKERLKKHQQEYQQLITGSHLNFANERDARSYLIELPSKIDKLNERIDNLEYARQQLQKKYGY